jgi:hypothetical protein
VNARLQMLASSFASIPLTLFGLTLVTFLIGRVMPIDPVIAIAGDHAPPDVIAAVRDQMGLDRPLLVQFWIYLVNLVHGDLGRSVMTSHLVTADIVQFFPATLELATTAIVIAIVIGVPLGVFAAARQGSACCACWCSTLSSVSRPAPGSSMSRMKDWCHVSRACWCWIRRLPATGIRSGTRWRTWRSRPWCLRISRWPTSRA